MTTKKTTQLNYDYAINLLKVAARKGDKQAQEFLLKRGIVTWQ